MVFICSHFLNGWLSLCFGFTKEEEPQLIEFGGLLFMLFSKAIFGRPRRNGDGVGVWRFLLLMVSSVDESPARAIIHSGVGQASILSVLASKDDRVGGFSTTFRSVAWKSPPNCVAGFNGLVWWNPFFYFARRDFVLLDSRLRLHFMAWSGH